MRARMARNYEKRFSGLNRFLEAKKGEHFFLLFRGSFFTVQIPPQKLKRRKTKGHPWYVIMTSLIITCSKLCLVLCGGSKFKSTKSEFGTC